LERQKAFREDHLGLVQEAHARGDLVIAGALADPPDGADMIFKGDRPAAAEEFARRDVYVQNGLITEWTVRPWNVAIGGDSIG
jgi:uncharacterized protein YciI